MQITLKVKTLDSQNFEFSIDDEMSVKQFKEHITGKVKIEANLQRLIYCGRVLNDEKPLKDYGVDGKCLHLVQRAPPSSTAPATSSNTTTSSGERFSGGASVNVELPNIDNLMMGSFAIPVTAEPSSTLCGNRITVARHMLQCANNIAAFLENPENGLNNQNIDLLAQQTMESTILEVGISAVTDAELPHHEMQNIVQAFQGAVSEAFRQNGINNITVQHQNATPGVQVVGSIPNQNAASASSSITIEFPSNPPDDNEGNRNTETSTNQPRPSSSETSRRQQTTSTQTLAEIVDMMQNVQIRLQPFIQQYNHILREDPVYADETARENAQRVFNRTSEALHYMAHAQHAVSDLMLNLSLPSPRHLCCRPILVEQSAFVSSGISQSINIGSLFARRSNNNNNNSNNNNNNSSASNNNTANSTEPINPPISNSSTRNDNFASQLLSAIGLASSNANNNNNNSSSVNVTADNNSAPQPAAPNPTVNASQNHEGQLPRSRIALPPMNRPHRFIRQSGPDRYRNFIQSLLNSSNQPEGVHIINANIAVPLRENSNTLGERSRDSSQTRATTNTQPTTSTQTRSTTRPFLTSTTLPSTSIRHGRPIPANFLSSFDRFLPCNSHHIRESSNQQQQQQAQSQSTPGPIFTEPARVVNRNFPSNANPVIRNAAAFTNVEEDLNRRFTLFGIELSLRDLRDNLGAGFYGRQREDLRLFLRQRFFESELTESSVDNGVKKMIKEVEKYLQLLEKYPQNDFIARESAEKYLAASIPRLIRTIFDDNSMEFGSTFEIQLSQFCQQFYMILIKCIGSQNAEKYLNDIANMVMTGSLINLSSLIQKYIDNRKSNNFSEIQEFLIRRKGNVNVVDSVVDRMEVDDESSSSNVQSQDIEIEPLPKITTSEPWHVHFSTNWLPIIARDIERQQRQVFQTNFSDAYISGMSTKRRKIFQNKKSLSNMKQMVYEVVRESMSSTRSLANSQQPLDEIVQSLTQDPIFADAYRDEVKAAVSNRLKNDEDYDENKYPHSSKAFN